MGICRPGWKLGKSSLDKIDEISIIRIVAGDLANLHRALMPKSLGLSPRKTHGSDSERLERVNRGFVAERVFQRSFVDIESPRQQEKAVGSLPKNAICLIRNASSQGRAMR